VTNDTLHLDADPSMNDTPDAAEDERTHHDFHTFLPPVAAHQVSGSCPDNHHHDAEEATCCSHESVLRGAVENGALPPEKQYRPCV
jgi:hypothetical protein